MRRILLMLPALALAACQADAPTATDLSLAEMQQPNSAGLQMILLDWVVDSEQETLEVFVINPTEAYQNCDTAGVRVSVSHPNTTVVAVPAAVEVHGADFCADPDHWKDVTSGDEDPDLAVHLDGGVVCEALEEYGGTHVHLEVLPMSPSGEPAGGAWETFRVRCPYD